MNRKYTPAHYENGQMTPEGRAFTNARKREKRVPETQRRQREKACRIEIKEQEAARLEPENLVKLLHHTWGPDDVQRWYDYAKQRNARVIIRQTDLSRISSMELVPNEPFRLAFERAYDKPAAAAAIVAELGKMEERDNSSYCSVSFRDEGKLREHLGVDKRYNQNGVSVSLFCSYQIAEAACKAMGMTPHECGI